jgi:hypothetical protein
MDLFLDAQNSSGIYFEFLSERDDSKFRARLALSQAFLSGLGALVLFEA